MWASSPSRRAAGIRETPAKVSVELGAWDAPLTANLHGWNGTARDELVGGAHSDAQVCGELGERQKLSGLRGSHAYIVFDLLNFR
jgi:hypothetical protein